MPDDTPQLDAVLHAAGDGDARLTALMVTATIGAAAIIGLTLPSAAPASGVLMIGAVVAGGSAATIGAYLVAPRLGWLPFLPASVTIAALVAATGGSTSSYWPLLFVLLVGGATLSRSKDVLSVALLVVLGCLSPLAYETWAEYATTSRALDVASWMLAALIVTRVSASLRATRHRVEQRTRLVSAVLGSLPQQAAVVSSSGRILLTNDAWDRATC